MSGAREHFAAASGVSRETLGDFDIYAGLLIKWQAAINLVGPDTLPDLWTRHFLDSISLLRAAPAALTFVDMGAGAGFPGMVAALCLKGRPGAQVNLIESNGKKAAFLRAVIQATGAPAQVTQMRVEAVASTLPRVDVVTARALAPLAQLLVWCEPLLKSGATGVFLKGRDLDKEVEDAARYWDIDFDLIPSLVSEQSTLIRVKAARRREEAMASSPKPRQRKFE